jgi:hypothetical protein
MLTQINLYLYSDGTKWLEYTGSLEYLFLDWRDNGGAEEQTGYTEEEFYRHLAEDGEVIFGGGAAPTFIIEALGRF